MKSRLVVSILFFLILVYGCAKEESLTLKIKLTENVTNLPMSECEVCLYEIRKPIYSMWQFHKLLCLSTDNNGATEFTVQSRTHYRLDISNNEGFIFGSDEIRIKDLNKIKGFNFINVTDNVEVRVSLESQKKDVQKNDCPPWDSECIKNKKSPVLKESVTEKR